MQSTSGALTSRVYARTRHPGILGLYTRRPRSSRFDRRSLVLVAAAARPAAAQAAAAELTTAKWSPAHPECCENVFKLREYQEDAVESILDACCRGVTRALVSMPTGAHSAVHCLK
jgi:hypothetical protein